MQPAGVIASFYALDPAKPAPLSVGGLTAFAAFDSRDPGRPLLAIPMRPAAPPRARLLIGRHGAPVAQCLLPLDRGPGRDHAGQESWFILCGMPPGPALSAGTTAWSEQEVVNDLLLPAAAALEALHQRGDTHRAIRPDNVFRVAPGDPVTLGPFWAAPPASLQPLAFEPPYAAMCLPAGRGDGSIADDVYALGVLMLWCLLGPHAAQVVSWRDEAGLLTRKMEVGCLAALAGGFRLTPLMADLLRGMLAEDPDHRPSPALLLDPSQARARRVAARPPQRAQKPLELGNAVVWSARELAHALAREMERGAAMLRGGLIDRWLRRMLGDSQLAVRLEEAVQRRNSDLDPDDPRATALMVMGAIAVLDPLAPMVWRGIAFFPDGLGAALAAAQAANQGSLCGALEEAVVHGAILNWTAWQAKRPGMQELRQELRDWQSWLGQRGAMGGLRRLIYALNPMLPCASPLLGGRVVARLSELLPALDSAAASADQTQLPVDHHIAAFVAARADQSLLTEIGQIEAFVTVAERLRVLELFARVQTRASPVPLPGLAGWLLRCGLIDIDDWRNLKARAALRDKLAELARLGQLLPMVLVARDDGAKAQDSEGAEQAAARLEAIADEIARLEAGSLFRATLAQRNGHDIAAALGLVATLAGATALAVSF